MSDVGSARKIKDKVKAVVAEAPWLVGVGVEREDGIGFVVRVNVKAGTSGEARAKVAKDLAVTEPDTGAGSANAGANKSLRVEGVFVKIVEGD